MRLLGLLLIQLVILQARASVLDESLLLSQNEFYNSITANLSPEKDPDEKPEESPGNWSFDFGYDYFNSRTQPSDKAQLFRSEFNYLTDSWFEWGFGLNFGSASIEKLALLEGQIVFGKIWSYSQNKDSDWNPTFSSEFRYHMGAIYKLEQASDPTTPSGKADPFTLQQRSYEVRLESALWEPWRLKGSYRAYQYLQDFSSQVVASSASRAVAHPRGPLFNSLANLPSEYITFGIDYVVSTTISLKTSFAQAKEKLSTDKSQDLNLLAQINVNPDLNYGLGLGSLQSGDGSSPYAILNLNYKY